VIVELSLCHNSYIVAMNGFFLPLIFLEDRGTLIEQS